MTLTDAFRAHSDELAANASAAAAIHHLGDRGAQREDILEGFLGPLLPERFGIGRGEIWATNGNWSKQQDLILSDRIACPRLFVGGRSQILPAEGVAAVIEVESSLGSKEIADASANLAAARKLNKEEQSALVAHRRITLGPPTPTLGALFAYDLSTGLDTFRKNWDGAQSRLPPQERINLTCVLGELVILQIDQEFHL